MQGISLRMARLDDAPAMTVMQRASWLAVADPSRWSSVYIAIRSGWANAFSAR